MSTRSLINTIKFILSIVMILSVFLPVQNLSHAEGLTTESEFSQKLVSQLSGPGSDSRVLGDTVRVPFFPRGFTYPIPELGNCNNKEACRQYCEMTAHLEICALTSHRNGTMTSDQLTKTLTFVNYLNSDYLAACDSLATCKTLCDDITNQEQCNMLAMGLERGTRILGATDSSVSGAPYDSSLDYCESYEDCLLGSTSSQRESMMTDVISQALSWQHQGRVLNVSVDEFGYPIDGSSGSLVSPDPYQPSNYLSCVMNTPGADPNTPLINPEQFDQFSSGVDTCGEDFSPTAGQVEGYTNSGQQAVGDKANRLVECMMAATDQADIQTCLTR